MPQRFDEFAADQVEGFRKAEKLAARHHPCGDAAGGVEHAESGDESGQPKTDRDQGIDAAGKHAAAQGEQNRSPRVEAHGLHREGCNGAAHGQHRAYRQIDIPIGDDEGEADGKQRHLGKREDKVERIVQPAPEIGPEIEPGKPKHDRNDDRRRVAPRQKPGKATGVQRAVGGDAAPSLSADDGNASGIGSGRHGTASYPGPKPAKRIAPDQPRLDQHGDDQNKPEKGRDGSGRELSDRLHLHLDVIDHDSARGRVAFAQNLVDEDDEDDPQHAAKNTAAAAENRSATDDHGSDDDQFEALPRLSNQGTVLGHLHHARHRRAEGRQQIGAHAHPVRRDAGIVRGKLVAAGGEGLIAGGCLGEQDDAHDGEQGKDEDLIVEPPSVVFADEEEFRMLLGFGEERYGLAAGNPGDNAAADEKYGQRGDERRHAQDGDKGAVDEPDEKPDGEGPGNSHKQAGVEIGGREAHRKHRRGEPVERANRQIEILVDDDEGHADRHHAIARGIAHDRGERGGGSEKLGINIDADEIDQDQENQQAHFPTAENLHRQPAANRRRRRDDSRHAT